ncbi:DNA-directed RNA polymerase II subunit RPB11a, putative [Talaromyces stipitatus ATCC 10500]|uniref:DNA-directed RNA polymerase II subunit RPB11a, putative n=1 Tax=Talaromyces stipitatus (strain ATCC 10500 / CBS 375.48 / QM 6759 / NRRL 1006) TaxID=441959 RepID=B8LZG9_TALSN|nr:DNA-directed RNA polymerase II subunit RPB11a, putative [Talaromyces stipitatus ATCC 10500]EED21722.1 DNA-directed RNA polymerase II subunit RPB11a, putative [Talaromyces stipitatus ATCC 10500]
MPWTKNGEAAAASWNGNRYRDYSAPPPAVNVPRKTESFILGEGEKKIEEKADTRTPSTSIFTLNKEDHSVGNLLRGRLLQNRHVTFAAYKIPHPLVHKVELRVQTDGEITPKEALLAACHDTVRDLGTLSREFTKEFELRKMVGASQHQNGTQDGL